MGDQSKRLEIRVYSNRLVRFTLDHSNNDVLLLILRFIIFLTCGLHGLHIDIKYEGKKKKKNIRSTWSTRPGPV